MNKAGIFCSLLLLAFFATETGFLLEAEGAKQQLAEAEEIAFEAEKESLARALMENSVDSAIKQRLQESIILGLEPDKAKSRANAALSSLFKKMEDSFGEGISVKFCENCREESFLNENSTVFLAKAGAQAIEATYCFTGGLEKKEKISAEISGRHTKTEFMVPQGYCIKAEILG